MARKQEPNLVNNSDHYRILMRGGTANVLLMILISSITIIFPLLLLRSNTIFYSSTPFYITIVVLFVAVMYLRYWGVLIAAFTLVISGMFLDIPKNVFFVNTLCNILQVILLLLSYRLLKDRKRQTNKNLHYQSGEFYLSLYNLLIVCILLVYIGACLFSRDDISNYLVWLSVALFVITVIKSIKNKDSVLISYTFLIAFLPSTICSLLSAYFCKVPSDEFVNYCTTWTLSNYILLQTLGYIFFQLFYVREINAFKIDEEIPINVSSVAYYLAIVVINILIIYLIYSNVIGDYGYIYFFPWILGNVFLLFNLYFTRFDDACGIPDNERFKWYERRIITVEKNTSGVITIISFMLPLSVTIMKGSIPTVLIVLFAANIFFACLSVGLIWVPNKKIRFINLLKTIKTISYTYSITLLLISSIMIMFTAIK